jgi:hypothetical protein
MRRATSVSLFCLLAALTACSAHRDERLSQRLTCNTDSECGDNRCVDGMCTGTGSALGSVRASSRVDGVSGVVVEHEVVGDEVCTDSKQQTVCTLAPGAKVIWRAPLVDGYRFSGWTGDPGCESSAQVLALEVQKDITCVAHYVRRLKVAGGVADGQGAVSASSNSMFASCKDGVCEVDQGAEVTLGAPARDGYRLESWTGEGCSGTTSSISITPTVSNITCSAVYVVSLTVRGSALGNGDKPAPVVASSSSTNARCDGELCAVAAGAEVTLTAPAVEGLRFAGWSGDAGCSGGDAAITLKNVLSNVSCTASYVRRYAVAGSSQGATPAPALTASSADAFARCEGARCEVDDGGSATLLAPSISGYRLSSWTGEGCASTNGASVSVSDVHQDRSCQAHYVAGVAVIGTVLGADGSVQASSASSGASCAPGFCIIDVGGTVQLTAPSLPGRTFLGWEGDEGCSGTGLAITLSNVATSRSCTARYAARFVVSGNSVPAQAGSVSASSGAGNAACDGASCTVDEGSAARLEALPAAGFRFSGWSGGGDCAGNTAVLSLGDVRSNVTCNANFVPRFEVRADVAPAGAGTALVTSASAAAVCSGDVCTVDAGASASILATASAGFRFTGWSNCAVSGDNPLVLGNVSSSLRCTANFERIVFEVVGEAGVGGIVLGKLDGPDGPDCTNARCTVAYGNSVAFRAEPGTGYTFAGWSGCLVGPQQEIVLGNVTGASVCRAAFTRVRVTVSASASEGGTVSASSGGAACPNARCTLDYGQSVSVSAVPATGYRFVGWSECASSMETALTLDNVTGNRTCVATFTRLQLSVRSSVAPADSGDGACSSVGCAVAYGGGLTLTATARPGWAFARWSDCSTSTTRELALDNVTSDLACVANFDRVRITVSSSVAPANTGGVTCSAPNCTVDYGDMVTLVAAPASARYRFVAWSGCSTSTNPTLLLPSLTSAQSCVANFALVQRTVRAQVAASGGGRVSCDAGCLVDDGGALTLTATPDGGYDFAAWSCTPAVSGSAADLSITNIRQDHSCVASFRQQPPPVYTVSVANDGISTPGASYNDGACNGGVCTNVAAGGTVSLQAALPLRTSYVLTGWGNDCAASNTQLVFENGVAVYRAEVTDVRRSQTCIAQLTPASSISLDADLSYGGSSSVSVPPGSGYCAKTDGVSQCMVLPLTVATFETQVSNGFTFVGYQCRPVDVTTTNTTGVTSPVPSNTAVSCTARIDVILL